MPSLEIVAAPRESRPTVHQVARYRERPDGTVAVWLRSAEADRRLLVMTLGAATAAYFLEARKRRWPVSVLTCSEA